MRRPLPARMALQLAAAAQESRAARHELSGLGLIRTRDGEGERLLEVYHDRLREAVLARLPASERAALDRDLLRTLEAEAAARRAEGTEALQLMRRAASHLLRSGRFEAGEKLIGEVLAGLHIDIPTSNAGLVAAIAWERTRAAVRGLRFTPRPLEATPFELRYAAEVCATLSVETQIYGPLRAALLQARSLRNVARRY